MTVAAVFTQQLGGEWRGNSGLAPCPVCQAEGRKDQRGLSLRCEGGKLLAFCHKSGCDFRDITATGKLPAGAAVDRDAERESARKQAEYQAEQRKKARSVWSIGRPIAGSNAEKYLRGRGITCPLPETLRYLPDTFHGPSGRWVAAMLADVSTGGIHRTFLEKRGGRLSSNAKMMLGPCSGGAVPLSQGGGPLVVCEGIETGLSLVSILQDRSPVVLAALSTSGIKGLHLPSVAADLILAPDGDEAGRDAARTLAERADASGWNVSIMAAPESRDWNDVLLEGAAA